MGGEVFNKPVPKDAIDFFAVKKLTIGFDYRDVWREEHAYMFTVAKAMQVDILEDLHGAVASAIAEGKTFAQFQKELKPILVQKGWWGVQDMVDPLTGKTVAAQLGSPRRLKIIYDANIRTARAAGAWSRIQRTKDLMPYLLYQLGPSRKHRPEHEAINNTLLSADDPWWGIYYPPNGYRCKCWVRQVSRSEYADLSESEGYSTESPEIETVEWVNKRTGAVEQVPKGITPGWDTNAGQIRLAGMATKVADRLSDAAVALALVNALKGEE